MDSPYIHLMPTMCHLCCLSIRNGTFYRYALNKWKNICWLNKLRMRQAHLGSIVPFYLCREKKPNKYIYIHSVYIFNMGGYLCMNGDDIILSIELNTPHRGSRTVFQNYIGNKKKWRPCVKPDPQSHTPHCNSIPCHFCRVKTSRHPHSSIAITTPEIL